MFNFDAKIKTLLALIVLCVTGVIFSIYAIDKQIDSYISEMKTEVVVVNKSGNNINVEQDGERITITVNPKKETKEPQEEFYGIVTSNSGLNIRQEASVDSEKVGALYYGAKVKILEDCGDWYRTEQGYIFKEFVLKI